VPPGQAASADVLSRNLWRKIVTALIALGFLPDFAVHRVVAVALGVLSVDEDAGLFQLTVTPIRFEIAVEFAVLDSGLQDELSLCIPLANRAVTNAVAKLHLGEHATCLQIEATPALFASVDLRPLLFHLAVIPESLAEDWFCVAH
jgi:hypothetical protein